MTVSGESIPCAVGQEGSVSQDASTDWESFTRERPEALLLPLLLPSLMDVKAALSLSIFWDVEEVSEGLLMLLLGAEDAGDIDDATEGETCGTRSGVIDETCPRVKDSGPAELGVQAVTFGNEINPRYRQRQRRRCVSCLVDDMACCC